MVFKAFYLFLNIMWGIRTVSTNAVRVISPLIIHIYTKSNIPKSGQLKIMMIPQGKIAQGKLQAGISEGVPSWSS